MAASGKNRKGARGHLIDVSDAADEREDRDVWLAQPSSATLTQRRPLETSGQVGVVIEPEEYEEYSRLKNGAARDRPESTDDPSASRSPDRPAADGESYGAVQDVASFLAQLATPTPTPTEGGMGDEAESEDEFLAQLSRAPAQPSAAPSQRLGSAALEDATTSRRSERRPSSSRLRARFPRRWRWVSLAAVLLAVAGVVALLLQTPMQTASPGSPSAMSHATPDVFARLRGTLGVIDSQVTRAASGAVSRERAEIAAERTRAARRRAARRDSTARSRAGEHHRAAPVTAGAHPVSAGATVTLASTTTASSTPAPTQTGSEPVTTTPTTSQPTSTKESDSTKSATHPYGEGGVLGAGHMSGGS
jgi:hypothetical protein